MTVRSARITIHTHQISVLEAPERIRSAHRGEIIHRALAFVDQDTDGAALERAVQQALSLRGTRQGRWELEEDFLRPLMRALALPEVKPWFEKKVENLREIEVVDARGGLHRIDRVVLGREEIAVIDYKVGHREEEHESQVHLYTEIVEAIFRKPIHGYLLYIDEPTVVAVI